MLATAPAVGDSCEGGICGYVDAENKYALVVGLTEETKYWEEGNSWIISTLGEGWYMPSLDEFKNLRKGILAAGTFDDFNSKITALSGTALQTTVYYWTSTVNPENDAQAEYYKFMNSKGTDAAFEYGKKTGKERPVRAIKKVLFE